MKKVVIESEIKEVYIDSISIDKIYAVKGIYTIYKLHYLGENDGVHGWAFISLNNSLDFAYDIGSGIDKSDAMVLAIKSIINIGDNEVYEFESQREFLEWCLK